MIAATASLAGTAMAYKNYGNNANGQTNGPASKNSSSNGSGGNNGKKLHDDAMKQMQMWKC